MSLNVIYTTCAATEHPLLITGYPRSYLTRFQFCIRQRQRNAIDFILHMLPNTRIAYHTPTTPGHPLRTPNRVYASFPCERYILQVEPPCVCKRRDSADLLERILSMLDSAFCIFYLTSTALSLALYTFISADKSRAMTKIAVIAEQSLDSHRSTHSTTPRIR